MQVDREAVEETATSLVGCLLREDPGFGCPLVQVRLPRSKTAIQDIGYLLHASQPNSLLYQTSMFSGLHLIECKAMSPLAASITLPCLKQAPRRTCAINLTRTSGGKGTDGPCVRAQGLMTPLSRGEPAHYISTLPFLGRDPQDPSPFLKKDVERFLWNFLASRTAAGPATTGDLVALIVRTETFTIGLRCPVRGASFGCAAWLADPLVLATWLGVNI